MKAILLLFVIYCVGVLSTNSCDDKGDCKSSLPSFLKKFSKVDASVKSSGASITGLRVSKDDILNSRELIYQTLDAKKPVLLTNVDQYDKKKLLWSKYSITTEGPSAVLVIYPVTVKGYETFKLFNVPYPSSLSSNTTVSTAQYSGDDLKHVKEDFPSFINEDHPFSKAIAEAFANPGSIIRSESNNMFPPETLPSFKTFYQTNYPSISVDGWSYSGTTFPAQTVNLIVDHQIYAYLQTNKQFLIVQRIVATTAVSNPQSDRTRQGILFFQMRPQVCFTTPSVKPNTFSPTYMSNNQYTNSFSSSIVLPRDLRFSATDCSFTQSLPFSPSFSSQIGLEKWALSGSYNGNCVHFPSFQTDPVNGQTHSGSTFANDWSDYYDPDWNPCTTIRHSEVAMSYPSDLSAVYRINANGCSSGNSASQSYTSEFTMYFDRLVQVICRASDDGHTSRWYYGDTSGTFVVDLSSFWK